MYGFEWILVDCNGLIQTHIIDIIQDDDFHSQ